MSKTETLTNLQRIQLANIEASAEVGIPPEQGWEMLKQKLAQIHAAYAAEIRKAAGDPNKELSVIAEELGLGKRYRNGELSCAELLTEIKCRNGHAN